MIALVLIVLFGLGFAYFATQNTVPVSLYFGQDAVRGVPLYLVVLVSLGVGLVLTTSIGLIKSWVNKFKFGKKESELKKAQDEIGELTKRIHKLELENTKYKTELGEQDSDDNSL